MDADSTGGRTIGAKYSWPMNRSARGGGGGEGRLEILKFKWGAQPPPVVVVVYGIVTANWIGRGGGEIDIIPGSLLTYE